MTRTKKSKLLSFLLCFVMVATAFGQIPMIASATETGSDGLQIQQEGEDIDNLTLQKDEKCEIEVAGASSDVQWQYYAEDYEMWISIYGETSTKCTLTYAKVCNMLDANDQTKIRCTQQDGGTTVKSNEVTLTVKEAQDEAAAPARFSLRSAAPMVLSEGSDDVDEAESVAPQSDDPETPATYNVVINYVFENNEVVADPYTANLAAGSSFSVTVNFPEVQGYLPYVGEVQQNSIDLNYESISSDDTITVVYKPTNVDYTVIHYQQNLNDDNYTEVDREIKQGLTNSTVPEVAETYEGFYALLYEKPAIAADGSTIVEVHYDRYYYLMNFDLDGGYGVEPIYARYGSPIGDVGTPTKAGYSFEGWSLDGTTIVELPDTMPAENRTYKAVWKADDTAKVTVVFWGENADDEEYSYIKSSVVNVKPGTEFTYSEDGTLVCALEEHTHDASCGYACEQNEHQHDADCYTLTCTQETHSHSESCYTCGKETHSHGTECYEHVGDATTHLFAPSNPVNGQIYEWNLVIASGKSIYINGTWYKYDGALKDGNVATTTCGKPEHTHSDACGYSCGKTEHTHTDYTGSCYALTCTIEEHAHSNACGYSCGKTAHTHTSNCYMSGAGLDSKLWRFVKSDTVTVAADGSSVVNVYYDRTTFTLTFRANNSTVATITDKWGADISGEFNKAPFNTTYNGRAWKCTDTSKYSYALQTLDRMPQFDATFKLYDKSSNTLKTIYYYVENVGANVSEDTWPANTNNFTLQKTVQTYFNFATYNEEYHEIEGFTRYSASIAGFDGNQKDFSKNNTLYLYYLRNDYTLTFNNGYENVKSEEVQYQAQLSSYSSYTPEVPSAYEPDSVTFGGWYQNPQCSGAEYILSEHTMPLGNLILYAKWVPVQHTVEFYLDKNALDNNEKLCNDIIVNHGSMVTPAPEEPENGSYDFVGWFYMEDGVEKAFDFENMPVTKDMQVYGKWSSNVLKEYTIYYKTKLADGTEIEIAAPTTGGTLAGVTKTFEAKGGTELYTDYQDGYFPLVKSHSMTMDINATEDNDTNVYTFWYVQKEAVPYTVKYLNKETGAAVATEKTVADNRKAVVTETFVPVNGMMPDAYQKRLVVSAEDGAVNEIIFYYTEDTTHAYYKITHYTENLGKDSSGNSTWTEYASSQAVGTIGQAYSADPMTIPGFTYDSTVSETVASGELTADGLELKLYYTRNSYPYQVRYLEYGTNKVLHNPKTGTGKYGEIISESAIDIDNYKIVGSSSQTLNIRTEKSDTAENNIITFYYEEKEATISYQVVGPEGCGYVTPTSETVKVLTGKVEGSTASAKENFRFVGWYTDDACTIPVSETEGKLIGDKFKPVKNDDEPWVPTTYYAKFEYDLADLTITKAGIDELDHHESNSTGSEEKQTTIFHITGPDNYSQDVVICGNESVTIKDLKIGEYEVSEITSWSWRYNPDPIDKITLIPNAENSITFTNNRNKVYWLNGGAYAQNLFGTVDESGN